MAIKKRDTLLLSRRDGEGGHRRRCSGRRERRMGVCTTECVPTIESRFRCQKDQQPLHKATWN